MIIYGGFHNKWGVPLLIIHFNSWDFPITIQPLAIPDGKPHRII